MFIIYLIINRINNKKYIGQTILTVSERWNRHCWSCTIKSKKMIISTAIEKYGRNNFYIFEIDYATTLEESNRKEVFWGLFYNTLSPSGYNLKLGGRKYSVISEETKRKISIAHQGRKASSETLKKLSKSHMGHKVTEETKIKLSNINKGKKSHTNANIACSVKTSKKYLFISPQGQRIEILNMRRFAKENNLHLSAIHRVINGEQDNHKGWKFVKYLEKDMTNVPLSRRDKIKLNKQLITENE